MKGENSHAREKRKRHHTKIIQRQNPERVGRRSRGGGQIIQGGGRGITSSLTAVGATPTAVSEG